MICCPITTKIKGNPFEIRLPKGTLKEESAVLVHQVRTVDYAARGVQHLSSVSFEVLRDVRDMLAAILEIDG